MTIRADAVNTKKKTPLGRRGLHAGDLGMGGCRQRNLKLNLEEQTTPPGRSMERPRGVAINTGPLKSPVILSVARIRKRFERNRLRSKRAYAFINLDFGRVEDQ